MSSEGPIVVGIDGSATSRIALDVAAAEASRLDAPLKVVHAYVWPTYIPPRLLPAEGGEDTLRGQAEQLLRDEAGRARATHHGLQVLTSLPTQTPASALLDEASDARMIVLGTRGLGGFAGLAAGSVTVQVTSHATCPVLVVPPDSTEFSGPIVVGIDGSEPSERALQRSLDRAHGTRTRVVAVHGWTDPATTGGLPPVYSVDALEQEEARLLTEALAGRQETYPDVVIERRLVRGHPAGALLAAAGPGALICVGSRGRGGFRGLLLGSVSQTVLHHATCPVEIVR